MFNYGPEYALVPLASSLLSQRWSEGGARGPKPAPASDAAPAPEDPSTLTLQRLCAATGVRAWASPDNTYVSLTGTPEQVAAAKAAVAAFVTATSDRYGEVCVEEWMIPAIVGSKGANILQLQQATGAKLEIDKPKRVVTITGPHKEAIAAAKTALAALVAKLASQRAVIQTTSAGLAAVIGRGGATIRRLQVGPCVLLCWVAIPVCVSLCGCLYFPAACASVCVCALCVCVCPCVCVCVDA